METELQLKEVESTEFQFAEIVAQGQDILNFFKYPDTALSSHHSKFVLKNFPSLVKNYQLRYVNLFKRLFI